jgi:chromosome partitioning protein
LIEEAGYVSLYAKLSKTPPVQTPPVQTVRIDPRSLLEATMAAAALIAGADDTTTLNESALPSVLGGDAALRGCDHWMAAALFRRYAEQIRIGPDHGRARALHAISIVAGRPADAGFVLRAGAALGRGQGGLSAPVAARIKELGSVLGIAARDLWGEDFLELGAGGQRPLVITIGNEKGGSGKSTVAMHLVVALLKLGYAVGSLDLDGRQGTLSRYLANRRAFLETAGETARENAGEPILMPQHRRIDASGAAQRRPTKAEDRTRLREALAALANRQVVVIDTPGSDSTLSRLAHANADMVITPLNDSFLDVDVLAEVDRAKREVLAPSIYCRMVLEQNERRVLSEREPIHWIVMRNRLTHVDSRSKREIIGLLKQLAERLDFRLVAGFGERVVFHELFLSGLTLLDLPDDPARDRNRRSHHRACQEFRDLLLDIGAMV